jgi:cell division protein ZapA (FtsZ GTPase activity inhibitor)
MAESDIPVSLTVEIGGEKYAIRSTGDPREIERCADFVDESIRQVRRRAGLLDGYKATILAALSIAAQYYEAQGELEDLRARMAQRSMSLVAEIEAELTANDES